MPVETVVADTGVVRNQQDCDDELSGICLSCLTQTCAAKTACQHIDPHLAF